MTGKAAHERSIIGQPWNGGLCCPGMVGSTTMKSQSLGCSRWRGVPIMRHRAFICRRTMQVAP